MLRALLCAVLLTAGCAAADKGSLRAGAARVDITPAADAKLPMSGYAGRGEHTGIHDNLYVRAVVLDDGSAQAVIVAADVIGFDNATYEGAITRITSETGIPRDNVLLAGVHTHGAPTPAARPEYRAQLTDAVVSAVRQAKEKLQPARAGFGTGKASIAVNRRAQFADGGWWLGQNPDGPTDRTVAVVKFESVSGEPIAIFSNYGVHGVVMGQQNTRITGDLPGATARFVEAHYGGNVVAPWTSGAAGDQNPIYGPGNDFGQVNSLGRLLGEEVIRVADSIKTSPRTRIRGAQKVVTCPGRRLAPGAKPRDPNVQFVDADPVNIRLSLLMVNNVAFAGVSGEVLTMINQRLKKESPFSQTLMITDCNGSSGYLPDDEAYKKVSYEITTSRAKPGCAESAIVNGLLEMMDQ